MITSPISDQPMANLSFIPTFNSVQLFASNTKNNINLCESQLSLYLNIFWK